jgi:hypothetical protein
LAVPAPAGAVIGWQINPDLADCPSRRYPGNRQWLSLVLNSEYVIKAISLIDYMEAGSHRRQMENFQLGLTGEWENRRLKYPLTFCFATIILPLPACLSALAQE